MYRMSGARKTGIRKKSPGEPRQATDHVVTIADELYFTVVSILTLFLTTSQHISVVGS